MSSSGAPARPSEIDDLLSLVAHELKSPLTPLKAIAQLLRARMKRTREDGRELDMAAFDRNLASIERQVDRMAGIVNDLLETTRAQRGTFQLAMGPVDLAAIVRRVAQRQADASADEGRHTVSVDAPGPLALQGDEARLEQVVMNLVTNAVKFSPSGGRIEVSLRRAGGDAVLEVRDEGIGIEHGDLDRVGRAQFARGGGRAATFPGIGVGLYVTRLVAEGHGGELELESAGENKGTTVRVRLPIAPTG